MSFHRAALLSSFVSIVFQTAIEVPAHRPLAKQLRLPPNVNIHQNLPLYHNHIISTKCARCISKCSVGTISFTAPLSWSLLSPVYRSRNWSTEENSSNAPKESNGFAHGHLTGSKAQSTLHHPVQPHGSAPIVSHKLDCARATPGCSDPGHTWAAGSGCGDWVEESLAVTVMCWAALKKVWVQKPQHGLGRPQETFHRT